MKYGEPSQTTKICRTPADDNLCVLVELSEPSFVASVVLTKLWGLTHFTLLSLSASGMLYALVPCKQLCATNLGVGAEPKDTKTHNPALNLRFKMPMTNMKKHHLRTTQYLLFIFAKSCDVHLAKLFVGSLQVWAISSESCLSLLSKIKT
jgi:hypothetical protein